MESPRRILLATDLSARSDRAMDRAAMLMREHEAELVVLHVMEPSPEDWLGRRLSVWLPAEAADHTPQPRLTELVRRHLARTVGEALHQVRVRVESGDPPDVILQVAREEGCDLLVTGVARNEFLGRFTLGKTVDRLLRVADLPLLIVTDRPTEPYRRVVVTTDLSAASLAALEAAEALLPNRTLTVFHSRDLPYTSLANDPTALRAAIEESALAETKAFLEAAGLSDGVRARLRVLARAGPPERHLAHLVRQEAVDLVALTTHGRGVVLNALLGSVVRRIVMLLPCDALVVRAPRR